MDSDYLYRLIVTVFVFIPSSCVIAYLWPRKYPQVHYEKPPLTPLPKKDEAPILINEREVEKLQKIEPCLLCQYSGTTGDKNAQNLGNLILEYDGLISNSDLARMVHLYYNEFIYSNNEGQGTPVLEEDTVLSHLNNHRALTIYTNSADILYKTSPRSYTDYQNV